MAKEALHIPFDDFAEQLPVIFDTMAEQRRAVVVERHGQFYRVEPQTVTTTPVVQDDIWAGYDPAKVLEGLRQSAGALADVDRAELRKDLRAQRAQDSRGRHD